MILQAFRLYISTLTVAAQAVEIFKLGGPSCDGSLAMAHCELGSLLERSAPLDAIDHFTAAVALFRATAQPHKEARALYAAGLIAARACQAQVAESHLSLAARAFASLGSHYQHAQALYGLGKLAAHEHHLAAAVDHLSDSAAAFHELGAGEDEAWCLYRLGLVMVKSTDPELACAYFNDAKVLFEEEGRTKEQAKCLLRIGEAVGKVEPGAAVDPLEQVSTASSRLLTRLRVADSYVRMCRRWSYSSLCTTPPVLSYARTSCSTRSTGLRRRRARLSPSRVRARRTSPSPKRRRRTRSGRACGR